MKLTDKQRKAMFAGKNKASAKPRTKPASTTTQGSRDCGQPAGTQAVGFDGKTVAYASRFGERWNGWATPMFTKKEAEKAAKHAYADYEWRGKDLWVKNDSDTARMFLERDAEHVGEASQRGAGPGLAAAVLDAKVAHPNDPAAQRRFVDADMKERGFNFKVADDQRDQYAVLFDPTEPWAWERIKETYGLYGVGGYEMTWQTTGPAPDNRFKDELQERLASDRIPEEIRPYAENAVERGTEADQQALLGDIHDSGFDEWGDDDGVSVTAAELRKAAEKADANGRHSTARLLREQAGNLAKSDEP